MEVLLECVPRKDVAPNVLIPEEKVLLKGFIYSPNPQITMDYLSWIVFMLRRQPFIPLNKET